MEQLEEMGILPIDMVVVNLYPFAQTIAKKDVTLEEAIENIDIGGPTMIRSAAKNYKGVAVVVDPDDYKKIQAELYRANKIENFDTSAARIWTEQGVELLYLVTHATQELVNPKFCYEFEKATVYFDQDKDSQIVAEFKDGTQKVYGNPFADSFNKIWIMMDAIKGKGSHLCGINAAIPHVTAINGMQEAVGEIPDFPEELVKTSKDNQGNSIAVYVEGLSELMKNCYNNWNLPHELGVEWAKVGKEINLTAYNYYPSGQE